MWDDQSPLAKALLHEELKCLSNSISQIFGYYIVQFGGPTDNKILEMSRISNHIIVNKDIKCSPYQLPFLPASVDTIIFFHILESMDHPEVILKETYEALIPNGHIIIVGFNPYSLWGLCNNKWISPWKMRRLLTKSNFSVENYKTVYFRPPIKDPNRFLFLESLGQFFWPYFGASYIYVAQKIITGLTPIIPVNTIPTSIIRQNESVTNATRNFY